MPTLPERLEELAAEWAARRYNYPDERLSKEAFARNDGRETAFQEAAAELRDLLKNKRAQRSTRDHILYAEGRQAGVERCAAWHELMADKGGFDPTEAKWHREMADAFRSCLADTGHADDIRAS